MSLPLSQKALVQDVESKPTISQNLPLPKLRPGDLLVKIIMVALNPCDYKIGAAFPSPRAIIGNDFVGTVVQIHPGTSTNTNIQIGNTVCSFVHGSNPADGSNGTFAQYVRAPADLVLRVPADFPIEQAAALSLRLATASLVI